MYASKPCLSVMHWVSEYEKEYNPASPTHEWLYYLRTSGCLTYARVVLPMHEWLSRGDSMKPALLHVQ